MQSFDSLRNVVRFKKLSLPVLLKTIGTFFSAEIINVFTDPAPILQEKYGIEIRKRPKRGIYLLDNGYAILLGRVQSSDGLVAAFAIVLRSIFLKSLGNLVTNFEGSLSSLLSNSYAAGFNDAMHLYGDPLIERVISKHIGKGHYDPARVLFLIEMTRKLASTTFESAFFNTGFILTRSAYAYSGKKGEFRQGTAKQLKKRLSLSGISTPNKRLWYLADGDNSFFLLDRHHVLWGLFIREDSSDKGYFLEKYALTGTLKGGDALFRTGAPGTFSIVASDGVEFEYKEGAWRCRNLSSIVELFQREASLQRVDADALFFFVTTLSRKRKSSIIWIPNKSADDSDLFKVTNELLKEPLLINDMFHANTILRLLSSDGVTILTTSGLLEKYGCIVDLSRANLKGVIGTGESVLEILGAYGLAIKVSSDGNIKVCWPNCSCPISL